jgi:RNA polymerase sigma-70 factor (ECF subfamily)
MGGPAGDPLTQGLAEGREEAFAALYDRFGTALFRVACALLPARADAEDAVQEVFVSLVRSRHALGRVENLRAYLFAALRFAALRIATARKQERRAAEMDLTHVPAPTTDSVEIEQAVRLERALGLLPPAQRELVALKIDGGLTFAEIASCLGISPNTAASRYRYALEKLRAALEERSDEPSRSLG